MCPHRTGPILHLEDLEHPLMVKSVDFKGPSVELICITGTPAMIDVSFEELLRENRRRIRLHRWTHQSEAHDQEERAMSSDLSSARFVGVLSDLHRDGAMALQKRSPRNGLGGDPKKLAIDIWTLCIPRQAAYDGNRPAL